MAQQIDLRARGLFTHPNPLAEVPAGALLIANNVVIDREGTTETRRGFKRYGTQLANNINKFFEYQDRLLVHHGNKLAYDSDGAGTFSDYSGTYDPPSGAVRMRSILANKNFYYTTDDGVYKLDTLTATPSKAGGLKGLDGEGATTGASGWMANNTNVAYRVVFGFIDANKNKILGSPSQRIIVSNTSGGTRNVNITFTLPADMTINHFYQVYRSGQTTAVADEPNDELQLIVEKNPTAGEISVGVGTYTDETPDNLRGAIIYTAPSQEGLVQSNAQPPIARDITQFKDYVMYANTIGKHRMTITIISIGGTNGLQVDDTVTIAGTTYTGKASETITNAEFQVYSAGTPSENIDTTARSLIRVINRYSGNTAVYATYLTSYNDLPGQILIEERTVGGSTFYATSSRGSAFSPNLPASGTSYSSGNDTEPNGVYISKLQQPEAVPLLNKINVGAANKNILRIIALRDSVMVFKEDGIFRITGESPADYVVTIFDNTTELIAEETAVNFNNAVHCFGDQGISAVSDSGVQIISRSVEFDLLKIASDQYTNFNSASFGISYESDRKYIMGTVDETTDTYATILHVYNTVTQSWTRWPYPTRCGLVLKADNKLYLGNAENKYVYVERKNYDATDYAMEEWPATITGSSGTTVNVSSTTNYAAGDTIAQFSGSAVIRESVIVSVDDATTITVRDTLSWTAGSATVYKPISTEIQYTPIHGGNPAMVHLWQDVIMMFSQANFDRLTLEFTSDQSISPDIFTVTAEKAGGWGLFPWGSLPWGQQVGLLQPIRTYVPMEKARSHWYRIKITHSQALSNFALVGISTFFEEVSEVFK